MYRRVAISFVTYSDIMVRKQATKSNHEIAANNFTEYGKNREGLIEMYQDLGCEIRKYSNESLQLTANRKIQDAILEISIIRDRREDA